MNTYIASVSSRRTKCWTVPFLLTVLSSMSHGSLQLLENFDSYIAGQNIGGQGSWTQTETDPASTALTVVNLGGSKVVQVGGVNTSTVFANMPLPLAAQIADGETGTFFFQLRYADNTGYYNGSSIGVANSAATTFAEQGALLLPGPSNTDAANLRAYNGNGSGGAGTPSTYVIAGPGSMTGAVLPAAGTWLNIWLVATNTTGSTNATFNVYMNTGDADATLADLVTSSSIAFRENPGTNAIDHFFLSDDGQASNHSKLFYVDNIYYGSGASLVNPIPEPATYALITGFVFLAFTALRKRRQS